MPHSVASDLLLGAPSFSHLLASVLCETTARLHAIRPMSLVGSGSCWHAPAARICSIAILLCNFCHLRNACNSFGSGPASSGRRKAFFVARNAVLVVREQHAPVVAPVATCGLKLCQTSRALPCVNGPGLAPAASFCRVLRSSSFAFAFLSAGLPTAFLLLCASHLAFRTCAACGPIFVFLPLLHGFSAARASCARPALAWSGRAAPPQHAANSAVADFAIIFLTLGCPPSDRSLFVCALVSLRPSHLFNSLVAADDFALRRWLRASARGLVPEQALLPAVRLLPAPRRTSALVTDFCPFLIARVSPSPSRPHGSGPGARR